MVYEEVDTKADIYSSTPNLTGSTVRIDFVIMLQKDRRMR